MKKVITLLLCSLVFLGGKSFLYSQDVDSRVKSRDYKPSSAKTYDIEEDKGLSPLGCIHGSCTFSTSIKIFSDLVDVYVAQAYDLGEKAKRATNEIDKFVLLKQQAQALDLASFNAHRRQEALSGMKTRV